MKNRLLNLYIILSTILFTVSIVTINSEAFSNNELTVIKEVSNGLLNRETTINVSKYKITKDRVLDIVQEIRDRNILICDANRKVTFNYIHYENSKNIEAFQLSYDCSEQEYKTRLNAINNAIDSIIKNEINNSMTDYEKALIVHDYLISITDYDKIGIQNNNVPRDNYTSYGVLVNNVGVCGGYSRAYELIMNKLGIDTIRVLSEKMNHEWNMIKLNNKWYHVDVTWDDPSSNKDAFNKEKVYHNYFLRSDNSLKNLKHHSWISLYVSLNDYEFLPFLKSQERVVYKNGYLYGIIDGTVYRIKNNVMEIATTEETTEYKEEINSTIADAKNIHPDNIKVKKIKTKKSSRVKLVWNYTSNVKVYKIYRSTKKRSGFKLLKTVSRTNNSTTLKAMNGKKYYYKVVAVLNDGSEVTSNTLKAKAQIKATKITYNYLSKNKNLLKYNKVKGANKYVIYGCKTRNGSYKRIKSTRKSSVTVNHKYKYIRIKVLDKHGKIKSYSNFSNIARLY